MMFYSRSFPVLARFSPAFNTGKPLLLHKMVFIQPRAPIKCSSWQLFMLILLDVDLGEAESPFHFTRAQQLIMYQLINPSEHGRFLDRFFKMLWEGLKLFFFIGAPSTKRFARSRILVIGCLKIFRVKGKKQGKEGAYSPPLPCCEGLSNPAGKQRRETNNIFSQAKLNLFFSCKSGILID